MRKELAKESGQRKKFTAVFSRIGKKINYKGYSQETVLLKNIIDVETNKLVTDHVWFSYTKGFEKVSLTEGIQLEFEARIKKYTKGYINVRYQINNGAIDYKLSNPTRIKRLQPENKSRESKA